MKTIMVAGCNSAIAYEILKKITQKGDRIYLMGRDSAKREIVSSDLRTRFQAEVDGLSFDFSELDLIESVFQQGVEYLKKIDLFLVSHGSLPDQASIENNASKVMNQLRINTLSALAFLTLAAEHMEKSHAGMIVAISSVSGDRGRRSNYIYGASKAALSAYLSGLRARLFESGVHVLTVKPGPVITPMTEKMTKGPLFISAELAALKIVSAMKRKKNVAYIPGFWRYIMLVICAIPEFIFKRIKL